MFDRVLHFTGKRATENQTTKKLKAMANLEKSGLVPFSRVRVWPFTVLTIVVTFVLFSRLVQLTVVEGGYQRQQAESNRVIAIRTAAVRGIFYDRNGKPLVRNNPAYKRQVSGTTLAEARFEEISREAAVKLQYQDGERVFYDIVREYALGRTTAHLLGYTGEVTAEELKFISGDYVMGDRLGKTGLEKAMERELRGQVGSELLEVNAQGEVQRSLGKIDQVAGADQKLTIDSGLQEVLYEAMREFEGAAVAQIPQTGEVLALVSTPAYDPNDVGTSLKEPNEPFFNRALGGGFPPGSVFKIVTAIAGLEEKKLTEQTTFEDTGEIKIDTYRYGNWLFNQYGRTEGQVDIVKGLQRSNDIFFYKVGEAVGAEKIAEWARLLGYGNTSGLMGLGEVGGLIPDPNWKSKVKGEKWFLGNTYHMAIGQGDVLVTPLQVNRSMGVVATGGILCPPIVNNQDIGKKSCQQLNLDPETVRLVKEGLVKACQPGGTGVAFFHFTPQVACKTGTAQEGGLMDNPHAWFTVFAPADNPEIALTILIEHGGQGSEVASPVAKKALEYWFSKSRN
jgi:penicillin-binding protein 2